MNYFCPRWCLTFHWWMEFQRRRSHLSPARRGLGSCTAEVSPRRLYLLEQMEQLLIAQKQSTKPLSMLDDAINFLASDLITEGHFTANMQAYATLETALRKLETIGERRPSRGKDRKGVNSIYGSQLRA